MIIYTLWFLFQIASAAPSWPLGSLPRLPSTIFQFGDSLADTGNAVIAFPDLYNRLITSPYGETFFHRPASRECDGRLIIDFLASAFGLPLLDPYLLQSANQSDWRHGVNFAMCGASALSLSFFDEHNIPVNRNTFPLDVQLRWFREFKDTSSTLQGTSDHRRPGDFSGALYVVGEIGGDDYGYLQLSGMDYEQIFQFVPFVVQAIRNFIQELYNTGARNFLVINIPLQGCSPASLIPRKGTDRLDRFGCIEAFNAVNARHNSLLRIAMDELRGILINASISYADLSGVLEAVLERPQEYGFTEMKGPCCGTPWQKFIIDCAMEQPVNGVMTRGQLCTDPSTHLFWNWAHYTEHFYSVAAKAFLAGEFIDAGDDAKLQ